MTPDPRIDYAELDQAVRAEIDGAVMHPTSTNQTLRLADALRAILNTPHLGGPDDSWGEGYSAALRHMRLLIAHQLDIAVAVQA